MARVLVMTVGVGKPENRAGYLEALRKSVRESHPERVVLLCTAESREIAGAAAGSCPPGIACQVREMAGGDDLERAFTEANALLDQLVGEGLLLEEVKLDFTFGTKAMTGGVLLAAIGRRIGSLQYVSGERGPDGLVKSGRERVTAFTPGRILASSDLELARRMVRDKLMFRPAALLLERLLRDDLLVGAERDEAQALHAAACAYDAWDRFRYAEAMANQGAALKPEVPSLAFLRCSGETLNRLGALKSTTRDDGQKLPKPPKPTVNLLADLVSNAARRAQEGAFDDAVARLYRATEMLAQLRLEGRGLKTDDLDVARLPSGLREKYEALREDGPKGKVKLGLRKAYDLLCDLDDPLGRDFAQATGLDRALQKRNQSLLAHGLRPVGESDYNALRDELVALARRTLGEEFDAACRDLTFPWMRAGDAGGVCPERG